MICDLANAIPGTTIWNTPERLQAWNSPVGVRGVSDVCGVYGLGRYAGLAGLNGLGDRAATDAEKNVASKMADAGDKAGVQALLAQLAPWSDSSWRPVSMGGWYGYTEVVQRASTNFMERNPGVATAVEFGDRMVNPLRAGDTLKTADDFYGVSAGAKAAALATARAACEASGGTWDPVKGCESAFTVPTWLKVVGALAVGGYALNAVAPFVGKR